MLAGVAGRLGPVRSLFWSTKSEEPLHPIPPHIKMPGYALTGEVEPCRDVCVHTDPGDIQHLREAAEIAAQALVFAEDLIEVGALTDDIDAAIREFIFEQG